MHDRIPCRGQALPEVENISGTEPAANAEDSAAESADRAVLVLADLGCLFIAAERWPAGAPPFCGRPTAPHSAYCPRHAALCRAETAAAPR